jgi:hypothetical protein
MLQSQDFQQAMAMRSRMRQARNAMNRQPGQPQPGQPQANMVPQGTGAVGDLSGGPKGGTQLESELGKLDPATRNVIMKMQPQVREELLQGMREEGPEGYRKFIQDYFKRLTEVKGPKTP